MPSLSLPVSGATNVFVNIAGAWKTAAYWVNVSSTWKQATAYVNVSGTWKQV